jgi:hypothetical protein
LGVYIRDNFLEFLDEKEVAVKRYYKSNFRYAGVIAT